VLLLLSTSSVTGPAELCLDDARALAASGHEVLFGCDTRRPGNYAEAIRKAGFQVMDELALCRTSGPVEIGRDIVRLRARLRQADLVHCRFSHDHVLALIALQGLRRRPALVRTAETAQTLRPGWLRSISFRACQAVLVPCEEYGRRLAEKHRVTQERIHLLAGRVDSMRFSPGDGSSLRAELGVGEGEVLFGLVSRIKVERRHELLVRSFARMAPEHPQAKLAIVGRGEHEPTIRDLVKKLHLEKRVLFAGYRAGEALVSAYRALDVMLWLAEGNDGTCRAVLEAMACGKPAIVAAEGAMRETVRNGTDGAVVSPDEDALAEAMARLCPNEARLPMGRAARQRAVEFSAERRAGALQVAYEKALQSAR
jgi:glycosyltransferase involved in cell wall biosynthesis